LFGGCGRGCRYARQFNEVITPTGERAEIHETNGAAQYLCGYGGSGHGRDGSGNGSGGGGGGGFLLGLALLGPLLGGLLLGLPLLLGPFLL
jgi:hypothetical protein